MFLGLYFTAAVSEPPAKLMSWEKTLVPDAGKTPRPQSCTVHSQLQAPWPNGKHEHIPCEVDTAASAERNHKGKHNHVNDAQLQLSNPELKLNIFFWLHSV